MSAEPQDARGPVGLLPRVRRLFLALALLLLAVELLEILDASSPLWPQLAVALLAVGVAVAVVAVVRVRGTRLTIGVDLVMTIALAATGWGIGRVGGVLAMLLGCSLLRVVHGDRRSAALGVGLLYSGYVSVAVLLEGPRGLLDLHFLVVGAALASFVAIIRQVAEAVAHHDVDAALDRELVDIVDQLHATTEADEVDELLATVPTRLGRVTRAVAPDLLDVPDVAPLVASPEPPGPPDGIAAGIHERLVRIQTDAMLARRLLRSEARYRRLAEDSRDGIYLRRPGAGCGSFPYVNEACRRLLGHLDQPGSTAIGLDRVVPEDRAGLSAALAAADGVVEPFRFRLQDADAPDGVRWLELCEVPVEVEEGAVRTLQGTVRDVTQSRRQAQALSDALEREQQAAQHLREVEQLRTTFLSAVGHELRTPMAGLMGAAQTIAARAEGLSTERARQLAGVVERQAARLTELLDDLLDVERLLRGKLTAEPEPTPLLQLARRVVANSNDTAGRVSVEGDDEVVLEVDPALVERILRNLVRNALQHTPADAAVRVAVEGHPYGALLVVEDDGPGIPEQLRGGVFSPLVHGPSAATSPSPGIGIGLSLVRRIAELHGGRAWVEESDGGGARMVVLLAGLPSGRAHGAELDVPSVVG